MAPADATGEGDPATEVDGAATVVERPRTPTSNPTPVPTPAPTPVSVAITTAAEALENEEVQRTRVFIRMGWLASLAGLGAVPFVESTRPMVIVFVTALTIGMVASFGFHQAFRDPTKFGPRSMWALGVMSVVNACIAVLFFGTFTIAPIMLVMGLHFIGRSDLSVRRVVWVIAATFHGATALALITGIVADPGVFAAGRPLSTESYLLGALYVQAAYALAYYTGKAQRQVSIRSITQLQRATRVASQRAALLEELRMDLARAQQAGAGRLTDQVLGGFTLGPVIGRGAYGEVYEASGPEPAAVKVLHVEHGADPMVLARFLREAAATASVASPHVVRVIATSEVDAATPFLAMERLRGVTLSDLLRRVGRMPPDEAVALMSQVCAGLDAARVAGIVHRDLKPQNLMVVGGVWKIMDFGVAALVDHGNTLTAGGIVGTPQFMAPEQARSEKVDHRTDLHALGAIAYRALTGRNAYAGPDVPAILYAVVHTMPIRPSVLAGLHPDVDRWTAIALAKNPAARFGSGAELADAFAAALRGELSLTDRSRADALIWQAPWQEAL
jgi:serine/threonine-protein kinase